MPNIASMPALPIHASPAAEKADAGGKENPADPVFAKLLREKADSIPMPLAGKLTASVAGIEIGSALSAPAQGPNSGEAPAGSQFPFIPQPDSGGGMRADAALHAAFSGGEVPEGGKKGLVIQPGAAGGNLTLPVPSEMTGNVPPSHLTREAQARGRKETVATGGEKTEKAEKAEKTDKPETIATIATIDSLPLLGQVTIPAVVAPLAVSSQTFAVSGQARRTVGEEDHHGGQPAILGSAGSTRYGQDEVKENERGSIAAAPFTFPTDGGGAPKVNPRAQFESDIRNSGEAAITDAADQRGSLKQPAEASSRASRPDLPELVFKAEKAAGKGDPLGTLVNDLSTGVSTPAAEHTAPASAVGAGAPGAAIANTGSGVPNLYDRIDQGSAPVVLHSGAQHVSVGVHDPELGWVEIQTQGTAGHVDATLIAASGQSHDSLAAQLPAISQYLEQRDVRVGTLVVHHQAMGSGSSGAGGSGSGYGSAGYGAGAGTHQSNSGNSRGESFIPGTHAISPMRVHSGFGVEAGPSGDAVGGPPRPLSYISVRV